MVNTNEKFIDLNIREDSYGRYLFLRGLFTRALIISGYPKASIIISGYRKASMVRLLVTEFGKDLKGSNLRFIQKNILEFF
jgi:hypothetical protein